MGRKWVLNLVQNYRCSSQRGRQIQIQRMEKGNGMGFNQLSEAWWVVFELKLHADQVCDLTNRLKITCNIGQKGVPSWRISEDIHIPNIQANGGLVPKHIIHGWGKSFFQDYDKFTTGLSISKGDCISCKRHEPLCARQCAQCWNNCAVLPAPPLVTEDVPAPLLEYENAPTPKEEYPPTACSKIRWQ